LIKPASNKPFSLYKERGLGCGSSHFVSIDFNLIPAFKNEKISKPARKEPLPYGRQHFKCFA
jgi:hypothetical protein